MDDDENTNSGVKVTAAGIEYLLHQWRLWAVDELERCGISTSNQGEPLLNAELRHALTILLDRARANGAPR